MLDAIEVLREQSRHQPSSLADELRPCLDQVQEEVVELKQALKQLQDEVRDLGLQVRSSASAEELSVVARDVADRRQHFHEASKQALKQLQDEVRDLGLQVRSSASAEELPVVARDVPDRKQQVEQLTALSEEVADLKQQQKRQLEFQATCSGWATQLSALATEVAELQQQQQEGHQQQQEQEPQEQQEPVGELEPEVGKELTKETLLWQSFGYAIEESTWDSCAFMGMECVGGFGTLLIFVALILTAAMETLFILVVYANHAEHPFSDEALAGLLHWRAVIAHDFRNSDPVSKVSLAARICAEASSTATAGFQMNQYTDFSVFRNPAIDELSALNGHVLCNMALCLWYFDILHDILSNVRFACSILAHPRGYSSTEYFGDQIRIRSFSMLQITLMFLFSILPRLLIAILLGVAGTYFLVYTSNVGDLLLNAVALAFVFDIDEMFFRAFLPERIKLVMRRVEPLCMEAADSRASTGTRIQSWLNQHYATLLFRLVSTGTALMICNIFVLVPFNEKLDTAIYYLCGGKKDILYSEGKLNGLVSYAESPPFDAEQVYRMSYQKRVVLQLLELDPDLYSQGLEDYVNASMEAMDFASLRALHQGTKEDESSRMSCVDHTERNQLEGSYVPGLVPFYLETSKVFVSDYLNMSTFETCSQLDVDEVCFSPGNPFLRAWCARHCGCDNPWSGQFFATSFSGCPTQCENRWQVNAHYVPPPSISQFTDHCMDVPGHVLMNEKSWKTYLKGFANYFNVLFDDPTVFEDVKTIEQMGCRTLSSIREQINICRPSKDFRSARLWCPRTCMCTMSDMQECPSSCSSIPRFQVLAPGDRCPPALRVESARECQIAAAELYMVQMSNSSSSDCFAQHDLLVSMYGKESRAICRQVQPLFLDDQSHGYVELGQLMAYRYLYS